MAIQEITGEVCDKVSSACYSVLLNIPELSYQQGSIIDYSVSAQYWGVAFTSTLSLYLFSHGIGLVLKFVRNI